MITAGLVLCGAGYLLGLACMERNIVVATGITFVCVVAGLSLVCFGAAS